MYLFLYWKIHLMSIVNFYYEPVTVLGTQETKRRNRVRISLFMMLIDQLGNQTVIL